MNRILAAIVLGVFAISTARADEFGQKRQYTIVNEQIDPIPLPFQAAVFRRAFQNRTDGQLTAEYPEHGAVIRKIGGQDRTEYRTSRGATIGGARPTPGFESAPRTQLVPLVLPPHSQSTIRYSFAAEWLGADAAVPLFPEAGTYSFRLYYDDELQIVVREPVGDDKLIVDQLRADPDLAAAMMSPIGRPPDEMLRSLERLVKLYPESTYADYARFALARHYANPPGAGSLRNVSDDRKIYVGELLKRIDASFAYAPDALVLLHRVSKSRGQDARAERVMATLQSDFPDATEFLDYLASQLSDEEWIAENPRAPVPIPDAEESPPNGRP